jgi:LL-diaminopimelate aminotransferase
LAVWRSDRLSQLPPYLFVEIDRKKEAAKASGRDIIDFGIGDPDQPTPGFILERMAEAVRDPRHHRYPLGIGMRDFRQAVATFFQARFGVELDPQTEVLALIGSKEGIGHLPTAVTNPQDVMLVPEPGYPVYAAGAVLARCSCLKMPLREVNAWLPALDEIPLEQRRRAKLMFLNYPNNPTGATAPSAFFERAVEYAREYGILIAQDAAYSEIYFGERPTSILRIERAKDVCVEFHSLSKTFNMSGWRVGFAVGNPQALEALASVKDNLDSGVFGAIQRAAVEALRGFERPEVQGQRDVYRRRRDLVVMGLREAGWSVTSPQAGFYVWAKCPAGRQSMDVAGRILDEADVVVIPGAGFGPCGEGYVRFALTVNEDETREAVRRVARLSW